MKKVLALALALGLPGCGDFVDEDGNTSFRQVAEGLQSLGDRVAEMGDALERDAGTEAVPWRDLGEAIPDDLLGAKGMRVDGDDATDQNGAGLSIAHRKFATRADSTFIGIADLGALRSAADLALRWVAPIVAGAEIDGDFEEIEIGGYPGVRVRDEHDGGLLVGILVGGRFAVVAGGDGSNSEKFVWDALERIDYDRLEGWVDYGR